MVSNSSFCHFLRPSFPGLAGPHKAWLTLIVLWAFILRTRKLLEAPWRRRGSRNLRKRTHETLTPGRRDPAPKDNIETSCSPTATSCWTPQGWRTSPHLALSLPWESKNKNFYSMRFFSLWILSPASPTTLTVLVCLIPFCVFSWVIKLGLMLTYN